ncbi:Rv2640c family ArsR-like transcriptional regulator [Prescottella agglutinans]|uniref:Rv2640c family ArsR-like transcriptional regulator n=1 Tax=Prescottella agglutinans TaxID=1644129 RepID=UPI003D968ED9
MPKALPIVDVSAPICCAPVSAAPMGDDVALQVALRLKALADPVRIKLVSILLTTDGGEVCTCDLATGVNLAESTVSHHLGQLKKAGMVESERRGMNVYYRVRGESLDALRLVLDPNCCGESR